LPDLLLILDEPMVEPLDRYARAARFAPLGAEGQDRLRTARAVIVGCGALGSVLAERLARSGVGQLRIIDRDWVELSNLQRQTLFTEQDAAHGTPKAIAATEALRRINSDIELEACVEDITYRNIERLANGADLLLDGTDNFETRLLINDYSLAHGVPWVHAGVLGAAGQVLAVLPGQTACFRCLVPELPPRAALPTCDTAGVLGPAVGVVASMQAAEALKILSGRSAAVCRQLILIDTWNTAVRLVSMEALRESGQCPACHLGQHPFLSGEICSDTTVLCGKNAVQIDPAPGAPAPDLAALAAQWSKLGPVTHNAYLLRLAQAPHRLTLFADGRIIVDGTTDPALARSLVARSLGN
jgi:molybdopterin-synthase adenylyltransferase